jgi:hypothetical protein
MKTSRAIAVATMVAGALFAGSASAQKSKVAPAQIFYDGAYEVAALPADGATTTMNLAGLKSAHAAWLTFVKFTGGEAVAVRDAQVITLMEGVTVKWAGGKESCVYELRLVASPPAIAMTKPSTPCALKPPGTPVFRVLAM